MSKHQVGVTGRKRFRIWAFTLIEIVAAVAVLVIGIAAAMTLIPLSSRIAQKGTSVVRCTLASNKVLDESTAVVRKEGLGALFDVPRNQEVGGVELKLGFARIDGTPYQEKPDGTPIDKAYYLADSDRPTIVVQYVDAILGQAEITNLRYHHAG